MEVDGAASETGPNEDESQCTLMTKNVDEVPTEQICPVALNTGAADEERAQAVIVSEQKLEELAEQVCLRMQKVICTWLISLRASLEELKKDEKEDAGSSKRGFSNDTIALMVAVEAMLRVYNGSMPQRLHVNDKLVAEFYKVTLPESIYRGHVSEPADWREILYDLPLVQGLTQQLTAKSGLVCMLERFATHRESLYDFHICGLKHLMTLLTPGSVEDDIGDQFLQLALDTPHTNKQVVRLVMQLVIGVVYFVTALILTKERGMLCEEQQETIAQQTASKRTIRDIMQQETFSGEVNALAAKLSDKISMKDSEQGERKRRLRARRSAAPQEVVPETSNN